MRVSVCFRNTCERERVCQERVCEHVCESVSVLGACVGACVCEPCFTEPVQPSGNPSGSVWWVSLCPRERLCLGSVARGAVPGTSADIGCVGVSGTCPCPLVLIWRWPDSRSAVSHVLPPPAL